MNRPDHVPPLSISPRPRWRRLLAVAGVAVPATTEARPTEVSFRESALCGHACLHVYARLRGKTVSFDDILAAMLEHEYGVTPADLTDAAAGFGLDLTATRTPMDERTRTAEDLALPAILHLADGGGHYVVLLSRTTDGWLVADATRCVVEAVDGSWLLDHWSGFALIPRHPRRRWVFWTLSGLLLGLGWTMLATGRKARLRTATGGAAAFALSVVVGCDDHASPAKAVPRASADIAEQLTTPLKLPVADALAEVEVPTIDDGMWRQWLRIFGPDSREPAENVSRSIHRFANARDGASPAARRFATERLAGANGSAAADDLFGLDAIGGPRVKGLEARTGEAHPDQFLAWMAEIGVPPSAPVRIAKAERTLAVVITGRFGAYDGSEPEFEWTATAMAAYGYRIDGWTGRSGRRFDFDDLALRLMDRRSGRNSCYGLHKLQALTALVHIDAYRPILSPMVRTAAHDHLRAALRDAEAGQQPNGSWNPTWRQAAGDERTARLLGQVYGATDLPVVHVTGHLLEWLAAMPTELQPSAKVYQRAAEWCVTVLVVQPAEEFERHFCQYSHCFRFVRRCRDGAEQRLATR